MEKELDSKEKGNVTSLYDPVYYSRILGWGNRDVVI